MDGDTPRLPDLSPEDQRLLDALVECEFEPDALNLSVEDRQRAETILNLLGLLNDYPVDDADDSLIDATLARIDREERQRSDRMRIDDDERARRGGILARLRSPDFISVAAVILIGASVGLPMMHWLRQSSIDASCANNMRLMSYAFGNYAADYDGAVPVVQAGLFPTWNSGAQNAVNLRPLIELGYCEHGHLDCAGHDGTGPDYSYQWQVDGAKPRWMFGRPTLLLGDQNPVISGMRRGVTMSITAPSLNHGGRGQNVLSSDGSTMWLERSVIGNNDNIWLPAGVTYLYDGMRPEGAGDVFLAH